MAWMTGMRRRPGWLAVTTHRDRIDAVHVRRSTGSMPEVTTCESYPVEANASETLARMGRELKTDRLHCTTVMPRQDYQLHQLEAPGVVRAELKSAMRWRMRELIDYPVDTATIDVLDIPADPEAPAPEQVVFVVTARNDIIKKQMDTFDAARIPLEVIDIAEAAQRNIATLFEENGQGIATLAFYEEGSMLTFTRGGELYSVRRVDATLAQLASADAGRRSAYFERIALEVQRSLDHLSRQFHYVPLSKLMLAPLPADVELAEYLATIIDIPIESMDLSRVLDTSAVPELDNPEVQSRYLRTIGAALRDQQGASA